MPKFTLMLGRDVVQVYEFDKARVGIGRDDGMDIVIDNPSVSRRQAEFRKEETGWVVEDLGSSNGTFVNGARIAGRRGLEAGDEIAVGKFSIVFAKSVGAAAAAKGAPLARPTMDMHGTMHIKPHEVREILEESSKKRAAQLRWEAAGQQGTHYFTDAPAVLVGRDDLCDLQVPKGPKHHVLVIRGERGCEVRNLALFATMKLNGASTKKARLKDGDVVQIGGLKLTFVDAVT